jgi:ATP-dependent Clp protease protease subunit
MGGFEGQAADIKIHAEEVLKTKDQINKILSKHTGKPLSQIEKDTDRDYFMRPDEAKKYGIIDKVISGK